MKIMFDNEVGLSKTVIMSARIIINAGYRPSHTYHESLADTTLADGALPGFFSNTGEIQ